MCIIEFGFFLSERFEKFVCANKSSREIFDLFILYVYLMELLIVKTEEEN